MSTKQTQTKLKISDAAKDLKISGQELADMVSDKACQTWLGAGGLIFSCRVNGKMV